jgi:hypothetical protein
MGHDEYARERDRWIERQRASTARGGLVGNPAALEWWIGYARAVVSREDANDAMAALPDHMPMMALLVRRADYSADVGDAFAAAGRTSDAEAWLRRATGSCWALVNPIEWVRAHTSLGKILEAKGEREQACGEYAWVLARWPASTGAASAKDAAAGRARLSCK